MCTLLWNATNPACGHHHQHQLSTAVQATAASWIYSIPPGQRPKAVISCSIFKFPSLRLSRRWATLRVGREDVWSLPGRLSQCSAYKKNVTFCLFVVLDAHSFWHNWGQNMTSITFFHQDKVFFARKVEHEISLIFNGTKYQKLTVRLVINSLFNGL